MFGEDEEFIPGPSSNLASLFDRDPVDDGNSSLVYMAPKQPKPQTRTSKSNVGKNNLVDLILFKTVEAYKFENGSYQNHGKTGLAVLGNEDTSLYQILLYKDKLNYLCSAKINLQFKFLNQAKNYATFYDRQNQIWSVLFLSGDDAIEFSIQVALAKYNSEEKGCLLSQDLWLPADIDKNAVSNVGDSVEFQYTLYEQEKPNKLCKKVSARSTCAKVDTEGWEQELQNVHQDTQRLIIIPSEQLGDWKSVVPICSELIVHLTVTKVVNMLAEVAHLSQKPLKTLPSVNSESSNGEVTIKARGVSIKDSLTSSPKAAKANLISRMARMGQATLPVTGTTATPSDSDEMEEDQKVCTKRQLDIVPDLKPRSRNQCALPPVAAVMNSPWQSYMMSSVYPQVVGSPGDPSLPVFFSEVRTHNSELRMGMARVSDKVDNILSKLEARTDKVGNDDLLLPYIAKLSQENFSLKTQLEENYKQLKLQNEEVLSILSRFKSPEVSSGLPNYQEDEYKELVSKFEKSQENLSILREELSEQQKLNEKLKLQLEIKERELQSLDDLNEQLISERKQIEIEDSALGEKNKGEIAELEIQLRKAEEEVLLLREDHEKEMSELNCHLRKTEEEALTEKENHQLEMSSLKLALQNSEKDLSKLNQENSSITSAQLEESEKLLLQKNMKINELEISLQNHVAIIKELKSRLVNEKDKVDSSDDIKTIMNIVYRHLKAQFQQDVVYSTATIHAVLVDTIKAVTYQYLQSDSILRGNMGKLQSKPTISAETHLEEVTCKHTNNVAVEPQPQQDNSNTQTVPGDNKTSEETDTTELSLESTHSSVDKQTTAVAEPSTSAVQTQNVTEKGDFDACPENTEASSSDDAKPRQGPQGDEDDSADDSTFSSLQVLHKLLNPKKQALLYNFLMNKEQNEFI